MLQYNYQSEKYLSIDIHTYFIAEKGKNICCLIVGIMKFELLPSEIMIECFEYLNVPDIFYSFDQLNYH